MAAKKSQKAKSDEILAEGGKIPPQAVDVERYILGALLLDKEAVAVALEEIDEIHFYRDAHRQIFIAMISLYKKNEPIDLITLTEELQRQNALEDIGGAPYLAELASMVPSAANIEYHIQIVKEKGILRQLIHACTDILRDAYDSQAEVESVLSRAQQDIFDILKSQKQKSYQGINAILNETFTELERLHHMDHTGIIGVPSGFATLDNLTAGFQKGDLVILAGRPSMGKTAFGLNIARNAAVEGNVPIGLFSLEMSDMQLVQRLLCAEAMVDSQRLRTGHLRENEWPKLSRCAGRLADAPIYIDDSAGLDILKLSARARRMALERNVGLFIVDYMQLMEAPKGFDNRQQEISYISRSLKSLAKQLNVPIIALSQLSRAVEARPDRRPMLSDLRECITGDTLIYLPDEGHYVPVRELSGQSGFNILSLNTSLKLEPARCLDVWETGEKDVYEVETRAGFVIRVSLNHPFYTIDGWRQLKDLKMGDFIATSRELMHDLPESKLSDEEISLIAHMKGFSERTFQSALGTQYCGSTLYKSNISRNRLNRVAVLLDDISLLSYAESDIQWERIKRIDYVGKEMTYDIHVETHHNFVANNFIIHNSGAIEQDADLVMFVYREEFYLKDHDDPKYKEVENVAEIIVGKHRNGPVGTVHLTFLKQYGKFADKARDSEGMFEQGAPF